MGQVKIPGINDVRFAGRLTADPELRYTPAGKAYCKFDVCHNRYWKNAQGEQVTDAVFLSVTCWEKQAEFVGQKIKKGRPLLVEGELRQNSWEDKATGQKRSKLELHCQRVHVLDWDEDVKDQGGGSGNGRAATSAPPRPAPAPRQAQIPETDHGYANEEEIPF